MCRISCKYYAAKCTSPQADSTGLSALDYIINFAINSSVVLIMHRPFDNSPLGTLKFVVQKRWAWSKAAIMATSRRAQC
jgi:hypothetical protein